MLRTIFRYLNLLILTLLVLSFFSFLLAYVLPGDPLANLSGIENIQPEQRAMLVQKYHFDSNVMLQYLRYMQLLFAGDWGLSFSSGLPLSEALSESLPATTELVCYALIISLIIGLPLGYLAGMRYHKPVDYGLQSTAAFLYSIPVFWLALLFVLFLCMQLGLFPVSGRLSLLYDVPHSTGFILVDIWLSDMQDKQQAFSSAYQHMILPTLSIAIINTAIIIRITRRAFLDVMSQEYIEAARTRGLSSYQIFVRHVLRNSLVPILPLLASLVTTLFTNAMIVETIFSWPGVGHWLIQAIYQQDYPAIRAGMLGVSGIVVTVTVLIELIARLLDPTRDTYHHAEA